MSPAILDCSGRSVGLGGDELFQHVELLEHQAGVERRCRCRCRCVETCFERLTERGQQLISQLIVAEHVEQRRRRAFHLLPGVQPGGVDLISECRADADLKQWNKIPPEPWQGERLAVFLRHIHARLTRASGVARCVPQCGRGALPGTTQAAVPAARPADWIDKDE